MVHCAVNCGWTFLLHFPHVLDPPESQDIENKQQILHCTSIFSAATVCGSLGKHLDLMVDDEQRGTSIALKP
jgi:hypothetical protein